MCVNDSKGQFGLGPKACQLGHSLFADAISESESE